MLQHTPVALNPAVETAEIRQPTGLTKNVVDFLDNISYKRMVTEEELDKVFKLRHDNYVVAGHFEGTKNGKFSDELDYVPNVENIGIFINGDMVASARLHLLNKQFRQSCAMEIYDHVLNPKLDAGVTMVDTSRFCCDLKQAVRFKALPLAVMRLSGLLALQHQVDNILATVVADHVSFYKRVLEAKDWYEGGIQYPGLTAVVHLLAADMRNLKQMTYHNRQYLLSTPAEREALFGANRTDGHVRPTAHQVIYEGVPHDQDI